MPPTSLLKYMELTTYVLYYMYLYNIGTYNTVLAKTILLKTTTIYMIKIHLCDVFVKSIPREGFTFMVLKRTI